MRIKSTFIRSYGDRGFDALKGPIDFDSPEISQIEISKSSGVFSNGDSVFQLPSFIQAEYGICFRRLYLTFKEPHFLKSIYLCDCGDGGQIRKLDFLFHISDGSVISKQYEITQMDKECLEWHSLPICLPDISSCEIIFRSGWSRQKDHGWLHGMRFLIDQQMEKKLEQFALVRRRGLVALSMQYSLIWGRKEWQCHGEACELFRDGTLVEEEEKMSKAFHKEYKQSISCDIM
ncbi:hypothetical protein ADUPG1_007793 [Aduncisulcus paluster]|uniref:Uncharacterized protein n=1 Tax=Aduncisulcus paluster TaxID=2918883 RepID=A0ABQ5KSQ9_9EUKA|nr:hypothetical protein ADUPG1_007793 [Aduncisulcus paluster]